MPFRGEALHAPLKEIEPLQAVLAKDMLEVVRIVEERNMLNQ